MPIISSNVNFAGQAGVKPSIIFIETNDTVATVTTTGYLNVLSEQGIPLSNSDIAVVTTRPSPSSSDITASVYSMTFSSGDWSLVAIGGGGGGGSVILPTTTNHIAVYTDSDGTLSQDAATAINDGSIQANGNLIAGDPTVGQSGEVHIFPDAESSGSVILKARNVTAGDFSSTVQNGISLTKSKVYTLPNTNDNDAFLDPIICAYDSIAPSTTGNMALWGLDQGCLIDGGPVQIAVVKRASPLNLDSTALMDLDGNGVQLVPSPFPGAFGLTISYVIVSFIYGSVPYANTTGNFYLSYDAAGTIPCSEMLPQSLFTATEDKVFIIYPDPTLNAFNHSDITNALYFVSDNNMTTGDSGAIVTVFYSDFSAN